MLEKYDFIFFDLDGTLTDSAEGITKSVAYALEYFGIKVDDLSSLNRFIGPPLVDSFKEYYHMSDKDIEIAVAKYKERFAIKGMYENKLYDHVEQVLKQLRQKGKTIVLATSKPWEFAEKILQYFKIDGYFDYIAGSKMDGTRIRKHEVIKHAIETCQINNLDKILMVGDRHHDIEGAQKNKIDSCGVTYGYGTPQELKTAGATIIIDDIRQLPLGSGFKKFI